jgi:hypothetical protein
MSLVLSGQASAIASYRVPNVLVYVREKGAKRSFYPAPSIPDLSACYRLRYAS